MGSLESFLEREGYWVRFIHLFKDFAGIKKLMFEDEQEIIEKNSDRCVVLS
jgi:hypothetical protein